MMPTVLCARCGKNQVPTPDSVEIDPICVNCQIEMYPFNNDEGGCPGWNDSCGNLLCGEDDLCPDCTMGRLNDQTPKNYC